MPIITDRATPANEISMSPETFRFKVCLVGGSGSGKTTSLMTLPGRKLLVDIDNRGASVAGFENVWVIAAHERDHDNPQAWEFIIRKIGDELWAAYRAKSLPYDSIIFDGITMMNRISLNWAKTLNPKRGLGGTAAQQHYMPQMDNISKFILRILALPLHIGFTSHLEILSSGDDEGGPILTPKITGKLRTELPNWFNETYLCFRTKIQGKNRFFWQTGGADEEAFCKSSLNQLGRFWTDPIQVDFDVQKNPIGFEKLLHYRFTEAQKPDEVVRLPEKEKPEKKEKKEAN